MRHRRRRRRIFCVDCGQEQDGGRGSGVRTVARLGKVGSKYKYKYKMSGPPGDFPADELGQELLREVEEGDLQRVLQLLDEGADINYRGRSGETALMITAMENPTLDMIRLLLEKGADKTIRASPDGEFEGKTALEIFRNYLISDPDYADGPEIIRLLSDPVAPLGGEPAGGAKKKKKKKGGRSVRNKRRTTKKRARKTRKSRK